MREKPNIIKDKTYNFALKIIQLYQELRNQKEFVLSKQLLRSGTSIGANVEEGTAAQSRKDFISKMAIASKEARETHYWLRLLRDSKFCENVNVSGLIEESEEIIKIITAIVKTTQKEFKIQNSKLFLSFCTSRGGAVSKVHFLTFKIGLLIAFNSKLRIQNLKLFFPEKKYERSVFKFKDTI